jgi:hypothetical protein
MQNSEPAAAAGFFISISQDKQVAIVKTVREIVAICHLVGVKPRPIWLGDDGAMRVGHSGDMVQLLDDLGVPTIGPQEIRR